MRRELEREPPPVAVVLVGQRVHDRHRPRDRELERSRRVRPGEPDVVRVHGAAAPERARHRGHLGPVAVGPDPDRLAPLEVHTLDGPEEAVDEVLARLLAVGHDVDPRRLLLLERHEDGVPLGLGERRPLEAPGRPEGAGSGEPGRLGQAARDRGQEHSGVLPRD